MGIKGKMAGVIRKGTDYVANKISQAADKTKSLIHRWKTDAVERMEDGAGVVKIHLFIKPVLKGLLILLGTIVMAMRAGNWVTGIVASVVKLINGLLTVGPLRFEWGRKIAKKLPFGETVVALLESYGKLIATPAFKTKEVLKYFTEEATSVMRLRYGDEVARLFQDVLICFGLALNMSWNIFQILDPVGLPLDSLESFYSLYDSIGIHDMELEIQEHVPLPDNAEKISKILATEALALEEEKKKKAVSCIRSNQKKEVSSQRKNVASGPYPTYYDTSRTTYANKKTSYETPSASYQKKATMVLA